MDRFNSFFSFTSLSSLNLVREALTSLFSLVVFSDEHYDGGTVAAGGAAVPEHFF
jgi:hypothetical protein